MVATAGRYDVYAWFPALRFRSSVSVNRFRNRVRTAVP